MTKTVLIAGASGLVGFAAMKRFAAEPGTRVIAVSRRRPLETFGAEWHGADLTDEAACRDLFGAMSDVTHLVFAALHEQPGLMSGWLAQAQIETNGAMLRHLLRPLTAAARGLRHVTLLQGTKAYGAHVHQIDVPARPGRSEDRATPNFYWVQEDELRARQTGAAWDFTILRPQIVFGISLGAAMNLIPAIGVYAALQRAQGETALAFPGGPPIVLEACDADLLADAIAWAGESAAARGQAYNVTNGDVFVWHKVWPAIAAALGMRAGTPKPQPLGASMPARAAEWDAVRAAHKLTAPDLAAFVGESFHYADFCFATGMTGAQGLPPIVSTVSLRRDGFTRVIDTEEMFVKHIRDLQARRLLPPP